MLGKVPIRLLDMINVEIGDRSGIPSREQRRSVASLTRVILYGPRGVSLSNPGLRNRGVSI